MSPSLFPFVLPVILGIAYTVRLVQSASQLPDQVVTHYGFDLRPNGRMPKLVYELFSGVFLWLFIVGGIWLLRSPHVPAYAFLEYGGVIGLLFGTFWAVLAAPTGTNFRWITLPVSAVVVGLTVSGTALIA